MVWIECWSRILTTEYAPYKSTSFNDDVEIEQFSWQCSAFLTIHTNKRVGALAHFAFVLSLVFRIRFLINTGGLHFGNWFLIFAAWPLSHRTFIVCVCKMFYIPSIQLKKINSIEKCFFSFILHSLVEIVKNSLWSNLDGIELFDGWNKSTSECSFCNETKLSA